MNLAAPAGYRLEASGDGFVFTPIEPDPSRPVLGVSRVAGPLPDPAGLLPAVLPGWEPVGSWARTTAGATASGCGFRSWQADARGPVGAQPDLLSVLLVTLASGGKGYLVWALGNPAHAVLDGEPLLRVLHQAAADLPHGAAPSLVGTWRNSTPYGFSQYRFAGDGALERELAAATSLGTLESRTGATVTGTYQFDAGQLEIVLGGKTERFLARVFDELGYQAETPIRQLGLLPVDSGPEATFALVE